MGDVQLNGEYLILKEKKKKRDIFCSLLKKEEACLMGRLSGYRIF